MEISWVLFGNGAKGITCTSVLKIFKDCLYMLWVLGALVAGMRATENQQPART